MSTLCAYPSDAFSLTSFTGDERQSHFSYPSVHGYQATAPGAYAAWPGSEESQPRAEPAAKRRCLEKSRPAWPQMWAGSSSSSAAAGFCLGCAACQQQQGQGDRRPLQERHQNRLFGEAAVLAAAAAAAWAKNKEMLMSRPCTSAGGTLFRRQLSVDPKKDYSTPLFVDCSVEYDLPRVVRPPPGAQPLLIKASGVARYPSTANNNSSSSSSSTAAAWNSTNFDWFPNNEKNAKNVVKNALNHHSQRPSLDRIHLAVAAPAPHLLPVPNNGSVRSSGACACPSCLGRYWSPPVAATASAAAAGIAYQQPTMMPFMAPAMTYVEQQQPAAAAINNNNNSTTSSTSTRRGSSSSRKRSSAAARLEPVYPSAAAWMGGATAELVFNSGRMVAASAPWMTSQAPLKFSC